MGRLAVVAVGEDALEAVVEVNAHVRHAALRYRVLDVEVAAAERVAVVAHELGCVAQSKGHIETGAGLVSATVLAGAILAFAALGMGVKAGMLRDGPRAVALDERVSLRDGHTTRFASHVRPPSRLRRNTTSISP